MRATERIYTKSIALVVEYQGVALVRVQEILTEPDIEDMTF